MIDRCTLFSTEIRILIIDSVLSPYYCHATIDAFLTLHLLFHLSSHFILLNTIAHAFFVHLRHQHLNYQSIVASFYGAFCVSSMSAMSAIGCKVILSLSITRDHYINMDSIQRYLVLYR